MEIEVEFPKLNHFWFDSGLLGLYELLRSVENGVVSTVDDQGITIRGEEAAIEVALQEAYDALIKKYYDLSTKWQRGNRSEYNFYYDTARDAFVDFPKKKARGIASLIYDKAPRPAGNVVKWERKERRDVEVDGKDRKRWRGVLPPSYAHLQRRMDEFLDARGLEVTTNGLLLDRPNEIRPKIPKIRLVVKEGKRRGTCYFCGDIAGHFVEASQTVFPFITGGSGVRSFNTLAGRAEKVCWRCAFLGKFVPVNGFYVTRGEHLFAFFPYSTSLSKMDDVYGMLQDFVYDDPNYAKNFEHFLPVGDYAEGFFQRPFEIAFAFFHTLYRKLLVHERPDNETPVFDWEKMLEITLAKAPIEFVVVHAEKKGDTWMGKLVWPFRQTVYFFRLMNAVSEAGVDVKEVMRLLVDYSKTQFEQKTLIRNRICERILKQQSVLSLVESYGFSADLTYTKPLFDFVTVYEDIIRKEDAMTTEEQEAAVTLGRRIGTAIGHAAREKTGTGGNKGDLFALRKMRKKVDFLNQLNRLQFKYGLTIPPDVYEGKLTDTNYAEFKSFCMLAALNSFNAATRPKTEGA
jgi:hypothetical protein